MSPCVSNKNFLVSICIETAGTASKKSNSHCSSLGHLNSKEIIKRMRDLNRITDFCMKHIAFMLSMFEISQINIIDRYGYIKGIKGMVSYI